MKIEFKNIKDIDQNQFIELFNHPLVKRHMPLAPSPFVEEGYIKFIKDKETIWEKYGYGPWAFELNGTLIGWGGLQPVGSDTEIAIVLHPKYWGYGKEIYKKIINYAFEKLRLASIIILLPLSRKRLRGIIHLGFIRDGNVEINGHLFIRYRLKNAHK